MKQVLGILAVLLLVANVAVAQPAKTTGERVDDAKITAAVKAKLVADKARNLIAVNVDTSGGVVHLKGTVKTDQDRMEAERLAKETTGVVSVTNDLKVGTGGAAAPKR
jgi:hyperosmotically inducible protein